MLFADRVTIVSWVKRTVCIYSEHAGAQPSYFRPSSGNTAPHWDLLDTSVMSACVCVSVCVCVCVWGRVVDVDLIVCVRQCVFGFTVVAFALCSSHEAFAP